MKEYYGTKFNYKDLYNLDLSNKVKEFYKEDFDFLKKYDFNFENYLFNE